MQAAANTALLENQRLTVERLKNVLAVTQNQADLQKEQYLKKLTHAKQCGQRVRKRIVDAQIGHENAKVKKRLQEIAGRANTFPGTIKAGEMEHCKNRDTLHAPFRRRQEAVVNAENEAMYTRVKQVTPSAQVQKEPFKEAFRRHQVLKQQLRQVKSAGDIGKPMEAPLELPSSQRVLWGNELLCHSHNVHSVKPVTQNLPAKNDTLDRLQIAIAQGQKLRDHIAQDHLSHENRKLETRIAEIGQASKARQQSLAKAPSGCKNMLHAPARRENQRRIDLENAGQRQRLKAVSAAKQLSLEKLNASFEKHVICRQLRSRYSTPTRVCKRPAGLDSCKDTNIQARQNPTKSGSHPTSCKVESADYPVAGVAAAAMIEESLACAAEATTKEPTEASTRPVMAEQDVSFEPAEVSKATETSATSGERTPTATSPEEETETQLQTDGNKSKSVDGAVIEGAQAATAATPAKGAVEPSEVFEETTEASTRPAIAEQDASLEPAEVTKAIETSGTSREARPTATSPDEKAKTQRQATESFGHGTEHTESILIQLKQTTIEGLPNASSDNKLTEVIEQSSAQSRTLQGVSRTSDPDASNLIQLKQKAREGLLNAVSDNTLSGLFRREDARR
eukprot:gnl/MRDRNA2_/MRDRNA2_57493_c0_seq1.p1 gnl/MRDRNA2_/MRDRNA2_57493_c0~~gnl/MRDRNA2_/MRDRNA2_57493_c0_seq1.p1  ORF type:complete len:623 (+),score=153.72 gnl/MRDRNA2_/MRDRNA2_57493_c0_seq1:105-1973(+)